MKILQIPLLLTAGCLVMVSGQWTKIFADEIKPIAEECAVCLGADQEAVQKVYMMLELKTPIEKCLMYCGLRKWNVMNGTTLASVDTVVPLYKKLHAGYPDRIKDARKNVKECTTDGGKTDPCEIASVMMDCYRNQQPERCPDALTAMMKYLLSVPR